MNDRPPRRIVVMGPAGAGKTTLGASLAARLGASFLDADDAHPPANIEKMARGEPLDDEDRAPWLQVLRDALAGEERIVVTCSALKRRYRDMLRCAGPVQFVELRVDEATAAQRVGRRSGHFMKAGMVAGQFGEWEPPGADEADVLSVDGSAAPDRVLAEVLRALDPGGSDAGRSGTVPA